MAGNPRAARYIIFRNSRATRCTSKFSNVEAVLFLIIAFVTPRFTVLDSRFTSTHLLNHLLQLSRHLGNSIESDVHCAIVTAPNNRVHVRKLCILLWIILAKLRTATFLACKRCSRHRFRNSEEISQIERGVPTRVEFTVSAHPDLS